MQICKSIGCQNHTDGKKDFCDPCHNKEEVSLTLQERYPDQYKSLGDMTEIDPFAIHHLYQIQDHSGCIQEASRKLLLSGSSNTFYQDIKVARDLLTRWLQLNPERINT